MADGESIIKGMVFNKVTLSFPEKEEKLFLRKYFSDSLVQFRIAFTLVAGLYAAFGYLDSRMVPEYEYLFHVIRYYIVVPLLLFVLAVSFLDFFRKVWQILLFISFIVAGAGISIMNTLIPENYAYYAGMMLIFSSGYFFIKLRFFLSSIAGWTTLLFFNIGAIWYADASTMIIISNNFFFVSANLIGMFAAYNIEYYARRDFFLNQKIDLQKDAVEEINRNLEIIVEERTKELVEAKNKAEQSDRLKSAFLANMSHEIRTPMNAIIGFANFLTEAEDDEERNECCQLIIENGNHLLSLINDIIDISKIEAGMLELSKSEFVLNDLIQEVLRIFQNDQNVKIKDLKISCNNGLDSTDSIIYSDRKRLKQILINLINNACKFTDQGYVEFGYNLHSELLIFYVKDTGRGIELEKQKFIFERFMQGALDNTPDHDGSGLGLAISKSFVKLFGGEIWFESEKGIGSVFYFTLQFDRGIGSTYNQDKIKFEIMDDKWKNKVILIAEDVATNYILLQKFLKKTGANLIWAKNGQEAVDECRRNKNIDLVLMDIRMPVMNGIDATKQIKAINNDLPVIAQTAYAMDGDGERSRQAGCDDYISKPIILNEFMAMIEKYLG
jgi:signal transduction histidine kinase/CheY-like chemotaxis protein